MAPTPSQRNTPRSFGGRFLAAVFDMDGLLIDSERVMLDHWQDAARQTGCHLPRAACLDAIGRNHADTAEILSAALGSRAAFDAVARQAARLPHPPCPAKAGAAELLSALQARGIPRAVASSSHSADIEHRLAAVGLRPRIDARAGGDEVSHSKPAPDVYLLAARRLGIAPEQCLAFEDSEPGARAALAAGMCVVLVPDLKAPPQSLIPDCLQVLASLSDATGFLPAWFDTQ